MDIIERLHKSILSSVPADSFSGISISYIENQKSFNLNVGRADISSNVALTNEHYFEIASLTKSFVGILFSKLHLNSILDINHLISKYLTGLNEGTKNISVKELLTHASGLPRLPSNFINNNQNPYKDYSLDSLSKDLKILELNSKTSLYSNLGYALLGNIVEKIFNKSFQEVLKQEVLDPLGLGDIRFSSKAESYPLCTGYSNDLKVQEHWTLGIFEAAGGLRANTNQMTKYLYANIYPEETKLEREILFSHKVHYSDNELNVGLGWYVQPEKEFVFHDGGTYGFRSFIEFSKKTKKGIVVLANYYSDLSQILVAIDNVIQLDDTK